MRRTPSAPFALAALLTVLATVLAALPAFASGLGLVRGHVTSAVTHEPLAGVRVVVQGTRLGALSDERGAFTIADVPPGACNLELSLLGWRRRVIPELDVTVGRPVAIDVALEEEALSGDSIVVTASPFRRSAETPLSLQTIGANEIERFPGRQPRRLTRDPEPARRGERRELPQRRAHPRRRAERESLLRGRRRGAGHQPLRDAGFLGRTGRHDRRELRAGRGPLHQRVSPRAATR